MVLQRRGKKIAANSSIFLFSLENGSIDLPASRMRSGRSTNELIPQIRVVYYRPAHTYYIGCPDCKERKLNFILIFTTAPRRPGPPGSLLTLGPRNST